MIASNGGSYVGLEEVTPWRAAQVGADDNNDDVFEAFPSGLEGGQPVGSGKDEIGAEWPGKTLEPGLAETYEVGWRIAEATQEVTVNTTADTVVGACEAPPGDCTLREALQLAPPGAVIRVPAGEYNLVTGQLQVAQDRVVRGAGARSTIIRAAPNSRVLAGGRRFAGALGRDDHRWCPARAAGRRRAHGRGRCAGPRRQRGDRQPGRCRRRDCRLRRHLDRPQRDLRQHDGGRRQSRRQRCRHPRAVRAPVGDQLDDQRQPRRGRRGESAAASPRRARRASSTRRSLPTPPRRAPDSSESGPPTSRRRTTSSPTRCGRRSSPATSAGRSARARACRALATASPATAAACLTGRATSRTSLTRASGRSSTMAARPSPRGVAGSPALDAGGEGECATTDQRGILRPSGHACDVGAFEVGLPAARRSSSHRPRASCWPAPTCRSPATHAAGATVMLLVDGPPRRGAHANRDGDGTVLLRELVDGAHAVTATASDGNGTSPASAARAFTVDTRPDAPAVGGRRSSSRRVHARRPGRAGLGRDDLRRRDGARDGDGRPDGLVARARDVAPGEHAYSAVARDAAGQRLAALGGAHRPASSPQPPTPTPTPTPPPDAGPAAAAAGRRRGGQRRGQERQGADQGARHQPLRRAQGGEQIPVGTTVDTTKGRVTLTSAADGSGKTQTADFYEGIFRVSQTRGAKPITVLTLVETAELPERARERGARRRRRASCGATAAVASAPTASTARRPCAARSGSPRTAATRR